MDLYLTLDYELFLGERPGTPENCLVRPMKALMDILDKTDSKLTVLVDGAYLFRLNQLLDRSHIIRNDFELVSRNVREISERGHSVQYHFHPQWLYSSYSDEKGWIMDLDHYKLSDVPYEKLSEAFYKGIEIIERLTGKKIQAFRAGGYSLCSYDVYAPLFKGNGIVLDSSVRIGEKVETKYQAYDYEHSPNKPLYGFKDNVCREVGGNNIVFWEMPISFSSKMSALTYLLKRRVMINSFKSARIYGDGIGIASHLTKTQRLKAGMSKLLGCLRIPATIDDYESLALKEILEYHFRLKSGAFVIIGHPKLVSDVSLRIIDDFVNDAVSQGHSFRTFDDVVEVLKKS